MKQLFLIGGPMGVGKTTVCQAMKRQLPNAVFLDGDWCWDADPFQVTAETKAMVMENICFLLNQFLRCSAYENIVFCWVMHTQSILDDLLARLDRSGCQVVPVSLVCDEESLEQRLRKDIAQGLRSGDVIARSVSRLPLYRNLNTRKIDTSRKSVSEIAREILEG